MRISAGSTGGSVPVWKTTLDDLRVELVETARGPVEVGRAGTGPAVICVHGIPGSWRQAMPLAEDLATDFEVLLPSRPGYGATPLRVGRTYDEQADSYAALLDALNTERAAVIGISGGGPSAVAFAARHPNRVTALVLQCALVPHLFKAPRRMHLLRIWGLAEAAGPLVRAVARRRTRRDRSVEAYLKRTLTTDELRRAAAEEVRSDIVRHMLSHQAAPPGIAGLRNDCNQLRRAAESRPEVVCPTLVLHSDRDVLVPLDHAEYNATAITGAQLQIFEDAGHLFMVTRRSEVTATIRAFLSAGETRSSDA